MKNLNKFASVLCVLLCSVLVSLSFMSCSDDGGNDDDNSAAILAELGFVEPTLPESVGENALKGLTISRVDGGETEKFVFSNSTAVWTCSDDEELFETYNLVYTYNATSSILYMKLVSYAYEGYEGIGAISANNVVSVAKKMGMSGDGLEYVLLNAIEKFTRIYEYKVTKTDSKVTLTPLFKDPATTACSFECDSPSFSIGIDKNFINGSSNNGIEYSLAFTITCNSTNKTFTATVFEEIETEDEDTKEYTATYKKLGKVTGTYDFTTGTDYAADGSTITVKFTSLPTFETEGTYPTYTALTTNTEYTFEYSFVSFDGEYTIQ